MPTYAYLCTDCDKQFEKFHSMSETLEECVFCTSPKIKKVWNGGINLKKNKNFGSPKPGKIVRQYIEDTRKEVSEDKERLKKSEHASCFYLVCS